MHALLSTRLIQELSETLGITIDQLDAIPISGGDINQTFRLLINRRLSFFLKVNDAKRLPGLFAAEAAGLRLLAGQHIFRVPEVFNVGATDKLQWLVMEWIQPGEKTNNFWNCFGEKLAELHHVSNDRFGLDTNNYMGSLPQSNQWHVDWPGFYVSERLVPQIRHAADHGLLDEQQVAAFERLYPKLPKLFPESKPSLLHGDLWSGNYICSADEEPVLIDPAVYFGHAAVDIGMTELFGGFAPAFYQSYERGFHQPSQFREQRSVSQLYPLLIHLNLFGRSYLGSIMEILSRF